MISATRKWFKRNRTPFAVAFGVIGVGYVATNYVLGKISDARERMSSDRIARENLRRRFEQNQEDCTFTVLALLPTATENVIAALETERITYELQQQKAARLAKIGEGGPSEFGSTPPSVTDEDGRSMASMSVQSESGMHISQLGIPTLEKTAGPSVQDGGQQPVVKPRKTKLQLWNDLKISAITRAFTLIYTLALLTLLTRIQLNLLGRRSYLSSVVSLATGGLESSTISLENNDDDKTDQSYGNDFETNRQYLTFSWWLLHRGWRIVMEQVEAAVKEVFGPVSLRDDISMQRFSELTLEVRKKVEGATEAERAAKQWLEYLLPPRDQEQFVLKESGMSNAANSASLSIPLRRLLDETSDLIDSPTFTYVLTLLLDAGYSTLVDGKVASQAYKQPLPSITETSQITEIIDAKPVKLPVLLAILTKQAHSIGNGVPNEYLQAMEGVRDLEAFAAVVYSSNWENDMVPVEEEFKVEESGVLVGKVVEESGVLVGKVGESVVDVTKNAVDVTKTAFESAWGKAVEKTGEVADRVEVVKVEQ